MAAGVYTQRIRATVADVPRYIVAKLKLGRDAWTSYRDHNGPHPPERKRTVDGRIRFFERELGWFRREWKLF